MGILGRFILDSALKATGKALIKTGAAGKVIDAVSPTLNKVTKTKTNEEAVNDGSFTYNLVVENMNSKNIEDCYNVYDDDDNLKYVVKRPSDNWRYEIHIFNSKRKKNRDYNRT